MVGRFVRATYLFKNMPASAHMHTHIKYNSGSTFKNLLCINIGVCIYV